MHSRGSAAAVESSAESVHGAVMQFSRDTPSSLSTLLIESENGARLQGGRSDRGQTSGLKSRVRRRGPAEMWVTRWVPRSMRTAQCSVS